MGLGVKMIHSNAVGLNQESKKWNNQVMVFGVGGVIENSVFNFPDLRKVKKLGKEIFMIDKN